MAKKPEKIMLIAWGMPAGTQGSCVVIRNLARQFTRDEMIVVGERPRRTTQIQWKETDPQIVYLGASRGENRMAKLFDLLMIPWMCMKAIWIAVRNHCASIVVMYPDARHFTVGYIVARVTGAEFYPYLHNTWLENRRGLGRLYAKIMQPRTFAAARHIFLMSEGMKRYYDQQYPGVVCSPLVHPLVSEVPPYQDPPPPGSPVQLIIAGSVNTSCLDAVSRIHRALDKMPDAELTFLGQSTRESYMSLGLAGPKIKYDTVAGDAVLNRLRQADIMVLPHGFTGYFSPVEYQTIFPTKGIDYLISGRPILAHCPPKCFLADFLRSHECALIVDQPDEEALVQAVAKLRGDPELRARLVRNALKAAEIFLASRVAAHLREVLYEG